MFWFCVWLFSALFPIIPFTFSIASNTSCMETTTFAASSVPRSISWMDTPMRSFVLFAALELPSASDPISEATTANPLPASPALAASIEAFSAKRFVWSAMSSIVLMMLTTSLEVSVILFIASVIWSICILLSCIIFVTRAVSSADFNASSVFSFTCSDTETEVATSSSTEAACVLAPSAIFWAALERSSAPAETCAELLMIFSIIPCNDSEICIIPSFTFAKSPA